MIDILSPIAHLLVEQVIEGEKHAAPCFEFYPPNSKVALNLKGLFEGLASELSIAFEVATDSSTKEEIGRIMFCLKELAPEGWELAQF